MVRPFSVILLLSSALSSGFLGCAARDPAWDEGSSSGGGATKPDDGDKNTDFLNENPDVLVPDNFDIEGNDLSQRQVTCEGGRTTSLTGKVFDPAGKNPLYNVIVYVLKKADAEPVPVERGAQCSTCASQVLNPLVSTLTDTNGQFVLENVPVGAEIPVVVQIGKWRRKFVVDVTKVCEENAIADGEFRLPRNGREGELPQFAVSAGSLDSLECLLLAIGIDEEEFVQGHSDQGHVHLFRGNVGSSRGSRDCTQDLTACAPESTELWNDLRSLQKYDVVALSCEGSANASSQEARAAMTEYVQGGGRLFATHWHQTWFEESPRTDWRGLVSWSGFSGGPSLGWINQLFPKGRAFSEWLRTVGAAADARGRRIELEDTRNSISRIGSQVQSWIEGDSGEVVYFSFNAPVRARPEEQCGRAVFSDIHVIERHLRFPSECPTELTPQQKALEFMLFDLSACVQSDEEPPAVPIR